MTQIEFGKILGVNHRTISRWEKSQQLDFNINASLQKLIDITELSYDSWNSGEGWDIPEKPAMMCEYILPNSMQRKILIIPDDIDHGIFQVFPEVESDSQICSYTDACSIIKKAIDDGYCVGFFVK